MVCSYHYAAHHWIIFIPSPNLWHLCHSNDLTSHIHTFPYLSQACLMSYSYNPEAVIDHILQDDLLPHLKELDQSLTSLPPNWQTWSSIDNTLTSQSRGRGKEEGLPLDQAGSSGGSFYGDGFHGDSLLDQRSSVYDNDEFDVFRRKNIDRSRVHIGKKWVQFEGRDLIRNWKSHVCIIFTVLKLNPQSERILAIR